MADEKTGMIVCAHADGTARPHLLGPGETCPGPEVLALMEAVVADLDRIGQERGPDARAAAITDLLARLGA